MSLTAKHFHNDSSIRGIYKQDLTEQQIAQIASTFFTMIRGDQILIAYDNFAGAKTIASIFAFYAEVQQKQLDSLEMDVPDVFNFAIKTFNYSGGIYIGTDLSQKDGLIIQLLLEGGLKLNWEQFLTIYHSQNDLQLPQTFPVISLNYKDYSSEFAHYLFSKVELNSLNHFNIAVECNNGLAGNFLVKIFQQIANLEVIYLHQEPHPYFPHQRPLINKLELSQLQTLIKANDCDLGIIADQYGANLMICDEVGEIVPAGIILAGLKDHYHDEFAGDFLIIEEVLLLIKMLNDKNISLTQFVEAYKQPEVGVSKPLVNLTEIKAKFEYLLDNLWYTWNPHFILPIIDLYGDGWRKNSAPKEFISQFGVKRLEQILGDNAQGISDSFRLFQHYLHQTKWFGNYAEQSFYQKLHQHPIAYFSLEFGLVDWLQIYSGGLGVLAGDYLKEASDLGVPVVGVGIFYHEGYFHQDFGEYGEQLERYLNQDPVDYPLELVTDTEGNQLNIMVEVAGHQVFIRAWKLKVGAVPLYLIDTNYDKNKNWDDRMITGHLYGGDEDTRIRQEIVLGIGGARLLKAIQIEPSLYHMNEGHSGFLVLEEASQFVKTGYNFSEAVTKAANKLVFTNHTLKQAGNDVFSHDLITKHLGSYTDDLNTDLESIFNLGKDDQYANGKFSMTTLGLRHARISNSVSILHGMAAKKLWPEYTLHPVTNGVHMPTWVSPEIHDILDKFVGESWHYPEISVDLSKILAIPAQAIWQAHLVRKTKLITSLNNELGLGLDPDALTIAWSRRLASYKRPDLITQDIERLKKVVNYPNRPVQILIAGKAHPKDTLGKEILQKMNAALNIPEFRNKVVIIPGYNWQLARRMTSGADIWLNTPYRFEEASGTSGMKACANGVLQLTTKDGWTDEIDWFKKGWVISEDNSIQSLFDTLEFQIMPLFFDAHPGEPNQYWVEMMLNSMLLVLQNYSTTRMWKDYLEKIYKQVVF
ncbi:MAG: alpha-glucan family phosphorylase [bacterium]